MIKDPISLCIRDRRLTMNDLVTFCGLARDPHVHRYLLDGSVVDERWCEAEVARSAELFVSEGVWIWLRRIDDEDAGFGGFRVSDELSSAPQLLFVREGEWPGALGPTFSFRLTDLQGGLDVAE